MARPKVRKPLSNAERQAAYRERKKAAGLRRQSGWEDPAASAPAPALDGPEGLKKAWQEELKAEELKAARKEGREKERAKSQRQGYLTAMASVCRFLVRHERADIARYLLKEFNVTKRSFEEYHFTNFELKEIDKAGVFDKKSGRAKEGYL